MTYPNRRLRSLGWFVGAAVIALGPALYATDAPKTDDGDIAARVKAADGDYGDGAIVVVYEANDVVVADSGMGTDTQHRVVKILTDAGVRGQSIRRWAYQPATNLVKLESIRIHRKSGEIETVDVAEAVDQPAPAGIIFWGDRQLAISIPRLEIGDAVETVHIKRGFNVAYLASDETETWGGDLQPPMPGHWYDQVIWESDEPIIEKRYDVRVPKDKPLQYEIINGALASSIRFEGDDLCYHFEKKDIPAFKGQARMLSRSDVACKLVLATVKDWHDKARWFASANERSFEVDDAIQAEVDEVTAGLETDEEKWMALNHWVAENIRYVGSSRGACEGYTTHDAIETFRDRGGVCKDKAGMLVAMLRAAGYESHIVMTMAWSRVEETPADQFNHAVTCVRMADGSLKLLDPTWMPKSRENWSSAEQCQTVVFGTPDGEVGKQLTAYSPPEDNAATWRSRCSVLPDGALRGRIHLTTLGAPETALRRALARVRPVDRSSCIEQSLHALASNARVETAEVTEPADFSEPAALEVEYAAASYALGDETRWLVRLPAMSGALQDLFMQDIKGSADVTVADRRFAVRIRSTRRLDCEETIGLPPGFVASNLPAAVSLTGPAASLEFEISTTANSVHYRCLLDMKKHIIPVEEYGNFKQVIDKLDELAETMIVCRKGEQRVRR